MQANSLSYILTDIEGTTTSVSFVYEVLFPYFRSHLDETRNLVDLPEVHEVFEQTKNLHQTETGESLQSPEEILAVLRRWSEEDRKITPLKTLQGILWEKGYQSGEILGHVYPDVKPALENWQNQGIQMGVFSSGSVTAQKLIFGYSEAGDLTPFFSHYFDTKTGGKRDSATYSLIAEQIGIFPEQILFLSDIREELEAAQAAGFQTIQLLRPGTESAWKRSAASFADIPL